MDPALPCFLSPKFLALPLAAVLIICALPRAQVVSDHPVVATQKGVLKLSSPTNLLQIENGIGPRCALLLRPRRHPFNVAFAGAPERVAAELDYVAFAETLRQAALETGTNTTLTRNWTWQTREASDCWDSCSAVSP